MNDTPILSLTNIEARGFINYPDIHIFQKKVCLLKGESGAGKSTLFQILNGTLSPTKGEVLYNDRRVEEQNPLALRKEILLVSQSVFLFSETIEANFRKFYEYREEECISIEKMREYLELSKIPRDLNTSCTELSGGERQRVFIAICLSFLPKILLLDEPTSALDEESAQALMVNICEFIKKHKMALVLISHDSQLSHFADQEIVLKRQSADGRILT